MKNTKFIMLVSFLSILFIASSCSKKVDVEGDVFIIKGDGTPQPSAAKDVSFIKIDAENADPKEALIEILTNIYNQAYQGIEYTSENLTSFCMVSNNDVIKELKNTNDEFQKIKLANNVFADLEGKCSDFLKIKLKNHQSSVEDSLLTINDQKNTIENNLQQIKSLANEDLKKLNDYLKNIQNDLKSKLNLTYKDRDFYLTNNSEFIIYLDFGGGPAYQYVSASGDLWGGNIIRSARTIDVYDLRKKYTKRDQYGRVYDKYDIFMEPGESFILEDFIDYPYIRSIDNATLKNGGIKFKELNGKCPRGYDENQKLYYITPEQADIEYACLNIDTTKIHFIDDLVAVEFPAEDSTSGEYFFKRINFNKIAKEKNGQPNAVKIQEIKESNKTIQVAIDQSTQRNKSIGQNIKLSSGQCALYEDEVSYLEEGIGLFQECNFENLRKNSDWWLERGYAVNTDGSEFDFYSSKIASSLKPISLQSFASLVEDSTLSAITTINGSYALKEVPSGDYLILSEYIDNFNQGTYLKTTNLISSDGQREDLSNDNFFNVPLFYLVDSFFSHCETSVSCPDKLTWFKEVESDYEAFVKSNDEIEQALNALKESLSEFNY
jgi:hypothetical protein